jgi:glycosyltransferase involved in cell wall biosynthesis
LKTKRVSIEGLAVGDAKRAAYREAEFFVLPTLNQNFAITVAEALSVGTPVIATKGAPWRGLAEKGVVGRSITALNRLRRRSREPWK